VKFRALSQQKKKKIFFSSFFFFLILISYHFPSVLRLEIMKLGGKCVNGIMNEKTR